MYKVTVIIPTYNVEKYIVQCLNSVLNQSLKEIEIICIDNCSTDNTFNILNDYMRKFDNIKIIKNNKNLGPGPARNIGIKESTSEYFIFLDSDDYISENWIESLYNTIKKYECDIVSNLNIYADNNNNIFPFNINIRNYISEEEINNPDLYLEGISSVSIEDEKFRTKEWLESLACNKIYRKDFFIKHNLYYLNIEDGIEDIDLYYRMLLHNPKTAYNHIGIYYYRQRSDSKSGYGMKNKYILPSTIDLMINSINYYKDNNRKLLKYLYPKVWERIIVLFNTVQYKSNIYKKIHDIANIIDIDKKYINKKLLLNEYLAYEYYFFIKDHAEYEDYMYYFIEKKINNIISDYNKKMLNIENEYNAKINNIINYYNSKINQYDNRISNIEDNFNIIINNILNKYNDILSSNWIKLFGIYNDNSYIYIYLFGIRFKLKITDKYINKIAWWIPIKKWREDFREKFKMRPDQTRPDQTRPDQTRPE